MMKKFIAAVLSVAVTSTMIPVVFAAEDSLRYTENFDSEDISTVVTEKQNGWSYDGADGAEVSLWIGDNGSGSNSLRVSNGDSWFKNIWTGLDLTQNIKASLIAGGKDAQTAESETAELLSNDVKVSFKSKFETQGISNSDQPHQSYVRVKDGNYDILTEIRTMDEKLCIRARNADSTELTDYTVKNIDISAQNNEWHDFAIEYDIDKSLCRVTIDGTVAQTDNGEWIPLGTVEYPIESLSSIGSIEIGEYWSGWWQCVYFDDLAVEPITIEDEQPTAAPAEDELLYSEDFDAEGVGDAITAQTDGWSYSSSNADDQINIEISDKENTSNALRFSSTDWYKSMWIDLDLKTNGIAKRVAAGDDEATAEAEVTQYLSEDVTLSFRAKLDVDGISDNPTDVHESYIKVKNAETAAITELHTKGDTLYLKGLGSEEYHEIKKINIAKENTEYHTFEISYNMADNTYRLTVDGEAVSINGSETIKAGAGEGEAAIGSIGTLELGHHWSGWWQRLILDDVKLIKRAASQPTEKPSDAPDTTPAPTPTPDTGVYYSETFESTGLETEMEAQKNGWGFGTSQDHVGMEDISIDNYGSGSGKSLRFASKDYFKNVWMTLDLYENGVYKLTENGMAEVEAQQSVTEYLSGDMKLSFRAKFGQDGIDAAETHQQYIRIKSEDGHAITELHLYNNALKLIALDEDKTENVIYDVTEINWNNSKNEWHDFAIYYDKTRNAYILEIDGETFADTPHGKWIPAGSNTDVGVAEPMDMGRISSIEIGHTWSAWWGTVCMDNLEISEYIPPEDVFEIVNVSIRNQHGTTSVSPGNNYDAVVYITGGEAETIEKEWSKSYDNGTTWEPLSESTIPTGVTHIKVKVTAVSTEGETVEFEQEKEVNSSGTVDYAGVVTETFEASNKAREITAQENGWSITGTSYQVDVSTGFGGSSNSLRFASTNSNVNSNLSLDFTKRGAVYEPGDMIRLKFSYTFGLGNNDDTITSTAAAYVRIKDVNGKAFTAIELLGETMSLVYYDEEAGMNKNIVLATGKSQIIDVWKKVEMYLDTVRNKYCVIIDGKAIGDGDNKWFTPSDSIVAGIGSPMTVSGIGAIDIGQENSLWWSNTCIDDISLEKYYLPLESNFTVNDIELLNAFSASQPIVCGASINASAAIDENSEIKENTIVTNSVYTWTYKDADGNEKAMESAVVPYDAVSVKVTGVFTNAVGQEAAFEKEIAVGANSAPSVSELKVNGEFEAGSVLSAEYTYNDAEAPEKDNTVVSWYRSKTIDGDYELIESGVNEYTLKSADTKRYIKVTAVPTDSYGAEGTPIEIILSAEALTDFEQAWSRVNIDTNIDKDTSEIDLPQKDESTGITFEWSSNKSSVISSDGIVTTPKQYTTVILTATATNAAGETETRQYTIAVQGKTSSSSGSSGGGGGGGGYIPLPSKTPAPTAAPEATQEQSGSQESSSGMFPDVKQDAWYYEYVEKLAAAGVIDGDENGMFNPDKYVTRSEFVKMLVEIFNILDDEVTCEFTDVPEDSWYYSYVASAVKFDIAEGIGDGLFCPSDNILRQDMAVMAARAAQLTGILPESGSLNFADSESISDYASESVAVMAEAGILSGSDNMFAPKGITTRAQSAKVISMLYDILNNAE